MKKIIILSALALFVASTAFAAGNAAVVFGDAGKTLRGARASVGATSPSISKMSTNVGVGWRTALQGYAINTQHLNGVKAYGTSFDSTAIYVRDVTKGSPVAVPSTTGSDSFGTDWKTM
jgi:hypothetical protein